jgi:hypothetical protein
VNDDELRAWWEEQKAAGLVATPDFDPLALPENRYAVKLMQADRTKGVVLVNVVCGECQKERQRDRPIAHIYRTEVGPLYEATKSLPELRSTLDDIKDYAQATGVDDFSVPHEHHPAGRVLVLVDVPAADRPAGLATLWAWCKRHHRVEVDDELARRAVGRARGGKRQKVAASQPD